MTGAKRSRSGVRLKLSDAFLARRADRRRAGWAGGALAVLLASAVPALARDDSGGAPLPPAAAEGGGRLPVAPALLAAMARASSTYPAVVAAQSAARAAGIDIRAAKWRRVPTLSVQGVFYDQPNGGGDSRLVPGATVEMPVWAGGRIRNTIRRAVSSEQAMLAQVEEVALDVRLQTAAAYHDARRWRLRTAILDSGLVQMRRMQETMERRVAQEVSPLSDLQLARTRTLQVQQQRDQAAAQAGMAIQRLRVLVGDPAWEPDLTRDGVTPEAWPMLDRDSLVDAALAFDPRLQRMEAQARVAVADARIARASVLPSVNVQYSYDDFYRHRVGVALKAQSTGLSELVSADASRLRSTSAEQQVDTVRAELRNQVISDHIDYASAVQRLDGSAEAARSTGLVTESYLRQFVSGRRTWLDVMNAVREELTSALDDADVRAAASSAATRLMLRSGQIAMPDGDDNQ